MKNKLSDLNNALFCELERLSDEEISVEELTKEIGRAEAIVKVAAQIINTGSLVLKARQFQEEYGIENNPLLLEEKN